MVPLVLPSPVPRPPRGTDVTWLALGVGVGVGDDDGGVKGAPTTHGKFVMVFPCRLTAALRASTRPWTVAPVLTVILVSAMTVPTNVESDPSVAELVTCQKTLQDEAPLISLTTLPFPTIRSEPAWN